MICCFYGVLLCKQHPSLTIEPLLHSKSGSMTMQKWMYKGVKVALKQLIRVL